ncbi:aminotransferase class V-fold PLP-dependent enzyme [Vagococcus sp. DIV0080]|uniref:Aminotransferase class V-fold PLP-dependent enzyme n=1 Tax=Candidatus Vagococcus giribetii TaxID=2230876 RepID=A0ABS3HQT7_9ENTE|nr:aminotransferase class V-fold PLP-dependent enzyme [Vagococcus sp. DIV0080]MBO0476100.1 aminotransferase class V-fold PLP-dependent enzyme [Vagococcus sp. DIV0080]
MEIKDYMKQFIDDYYEENEDLRSKKTIELIEHNDFSELSELDILSTGRNVEDMIQVLQEKVYPNRLIGEHPRNFAFIPAPIEEISKLGDLINLMHNPNACGWYPSSGTATIEHSLINWLCQQAGYTEDGTGIFVSGGSTANLTAAIAARDGLLTPEEIPFGVAYISNQAHHSINKALHVVGIPESRIRRIKTDALLKIDPIALEEQIKLDKEKGLKPFIIMATAGTTNAGVIDPLAEIADVAKRNQVWFHVDGAFGASLLLSKSYSHLLKGIEEADSITWDAHKWLFQTYSCAMLLVKHRSSLLNSFSEQPEYLEDAHQADRTDFWDLGIELSRPARGVKLWLTLQTLGTEKIGEQIDAGVKLAEFTQSVIEGNPLFEVITPAQAGIINFRYQKEGLDTETLNHINTKISEKMIATGFSQVITTKLNGMVVLRMCTISPNTTHQDIEETIERLSDFAKDN